MMPLGDHASHWSNYLGELIKEMPLYYPSWQKVPAKRKAVIMTKIGMESSATRVYSSQIHTFFVKHTVGGVFTRDEDKAIYAPTPRRVCPTLKKDNALARKGKQRGHLPGVGRVLPRRATYVLSPPPPQCTHKSADVEKLKKKNNGSGGCRDDEMADDEDGGEDEEDGDS
nr:acidic leucine-rich nuclear phosphoprotein 32 family member A [Tanacetum cinerariifolium]